MGLSINGTDYLKIPAGTTAQSPVAPAIGMMRVKLQQADQILF
jgi:hypothetical protein